MMKAAKILLLYYDLKEFHVRIQWSAGFVIIPINIMPQRFVFLNSANRNKM